MGQFDYQATCNDIISRALRLVGAITLGDTVTADMFTPAKQALNEMVQAWQSDNIHIWRLSEITISLVATQSSYTTPTNPPIIGIESAFLRISGSDVPLDILSMRQYEEEIYNKTATGQPSAVLYVPTSPPTLTMWPIPTDTGTVACLAIQQLPDFDATTDTGGFSAKWSEVLAYNLAALLCDEYPLPLQERMYLERKAQEKLRKARLGNNEHPTDDFVKGAF